MDGISSRFVPASKSTYMVMVSGYKDKCLSGILYSPMTKKMYPFSNVIQLLLFMETLMDEAEFPRRTVEHRAFRAVPSSAEMKGDACNHNIPCLATMSIHILFRQNASWQGAVVWNERKTQSHFRSVLELIGLLDDALMAAEEQNA